MVGQRDTRWLTPLTVSSGYQGEEGDRTYHGATDNPTTVAPFILRLPRALPAFKQTDNLTEAVFGAMVCLVATIPYRQRLPFSHHQGSPLLKIKIVLCLCRKLSDLSADGVVGV